MTSAWLADLILALHFGFVLFIVGGFALILLGAARGWVWVRNRPFRCAHFGAIVIVATESVLGIACPLTLWEDALRQAQPGGTSFVGRWLGDLLYYDFPGWVFTAAYCAFAMAVLIAWRAIPPRATGPNPIARPD